MVETLKDSALVLGRIVTILPLLLAVTIFMGKRAIGELPIFDFLIILTLGAVVGADIADPQIKHIPTVIAIVLIALLQKAVARFKISSRKAGRLITFEPTIVVQDGIMLDQSLKKIDYSIDNLLQMLREKDVFDLREVETAVIEANGALSVLLKPTHRPVTAEDLEVHSAGSLIALPVVMDGEIQHSVLTDFKLDESWLMQKLNEKGITDITEVFYASINRRYELHISPKNNQAMHIPLLRH
ncbi:DUF421 domain-containing protein [Alteribacillus sp. HJP-4]|uniref:DUF421 domain-containing protein n=1 Tax=Alteribacillus sp. HJP-4 TaxID=2775394 RepID=UPI0035CCDFA9